MVKDRYPSIILISILILAALLRFFYLSQIQSDPLPDYVIKNDVFDQYRFMGPAKEFLKGNWLGPQISGSYSIAYSYLIAFLYILFPQNINTLFIFQIALGLLAVYIFYRAASLLFHNKTIGLIAAFTAAFYSPFLFYECNMERGAIIAYANLLGFFFLLKAMRKYRIRYFFLSGLAIGISMVMRGNALPFFIVPYMLFAMKKTFKFQILSIVIFLIGVLLVTSPLSIRNKIVSNTFLIEHQGILNFWVGNTYDSYGVDFRRLPSLGELTKECQNSVINTLKIFIREIKKYPEAYRSLYGRKIKMFFNAYEVPANLNYDLFKENHSLLKLAFITFGIICPLALLGIVVVRKKYPSAGLLYLFLCVLSISNILFHIQGRYRIPIVPFFIIFSSYAIYWCIDMARKREFSILCSAILGIILLSFYTKSDAAIIRYSLGSCIREIDYLNLANAYSEKAMDDKNSKDQKCKLFQQAATNIHKAIEINPSNLSAYLFLGEVYYQMGQYRTAKEIFDQALIMDPNNKTAKEYMASILLIDDMRGGKK